MSNPNEKFEDKIVKSLERSPEEFRKIQLLVMELLKNGDFPKIKEVISAVKELIKSKKPAKAKYYGLFLIRDVLQPRNKEVVDFFVKKLMERLSIIALFEPNNKNDVTRGKRCLNTYYNVSNAENDIYSQNFFELLLECWKRWGDMFQSDARIMEKVNKIRPFFLPTETHYGMNAYQPGKDYVSQQTSQSTGPALRAKPFATAPEPSSAPAPAPAPSSAAKPTVRADMKLATVDSIKAAIKEFDNLPEFFFENVPGISSKDDYNVFIPDMVEAIKAKSKAIEDDLVTLTGPDADFQRLRVETRKMITNDIVAAHERFLKSGDIAPLKTAFNSIEKDFRRMTVQEEKNPQSTGKPGGSTSTPSRPAATAKPPASSIPAEFEANFADINPNDFGKTVSVKQDAHSSYDWENFGNMNETPMKTAMRATEQTPGYDGGRLGVIKEESVEDSRTNFSRIKKSGPSSDAIRLEDFNDVDGGPDPQRSQRADFGDNMLKSQGLRKGGTADSRDFDFGPRSGGGGVTRSQPPTVSKDRDDFDAFLDPPKPKAATVTLGKQDRFDNFNLDTRQKSDMKNKSTDFEFDVDPKRNQPEKQDFEFGDKFEFGPPGDKKTRQDTRTGGSRGPASPANEPFVRQSRQQGNESSQSNHQSRYASRKESEEAVAFKQQQPASKTSFGTPQPIGGSFGPPQTGGGSFSAPSPISFGRFDAEQTAKPPQPVQKTNSGFGFGPSGAGSSEKGFDAFGLPRAGQEAEANTHFGSDTLKAGFFDQPLQHNSFQNVNFDTPDPQSIPKANAVQKPAAGPLPVPVVPQRKPENEPDIPLQQHQFDSGGNITKAPALGQAYPIIDQMRAQLKADNFGLASGEGEVEPAEEDDRIAQDPIRHSLPNDITTSKTIRIKKTDAPPASDGAGAERGSQAAGLAMENEVLKQQCETMFHKLMSLQKS